MHRNYEINHNKRSLGEEAKQENKRRVSVNLTETDFQLLENMAGSRSENLRTIIDWFRENTGGRNQ